MEIFKSKHESTLDVINQALIKTSNMGITHLTTSDERLEGSRIHVKNKKMINFGSCSYLGLEHDARLKAASIDAIQRYGTQFSCSRAYMSVTLYEEAERLFEQIYGRPINLSSTVTLAHMANIPVIVGNEDAIILDQQVHNSVQSACNEPKARGVYIDTIKHNRMDLLEDKIEMLSGQHNKVWYMADGIYSIYGDTAPIKELYALLDKFDNFYLYIDGAHGTGWCGKNGSGYVASQAPLHKKVILVSGLAKSYGACGGVTVFPTKLLRRKVRNCGNTHIFSGPIQPANLGTIIASAKIHLSEEIVSLQEGLLKKIRFFLSSAQLYNLPVINPSETPIFFIGIGKEEVSCNLVKRLMKEGYYVNVSVYPSVSENKTGLRIPLTMHHSLEEIDGLLRCIAKNLPLALHDEQAMMKDIYKAFRLPFHGSGQVIRIPRENIKQLPQYVAVR
jgi:7-keto-8-aminopelargonate synthetase-like enzyme